MTDELPTLGDALRDALPKYTAPDSLRAFAREQAARELHSAPRRRLATRVLLAAALVLMFGAGYGANSLLRIRADASERESMTVAVVDAHVRSLMSGHVIDVQSSDRHTVKPWFAGKVPLAPTVPDLAAGGFPLLGGRVETISGHTSAALVYGRRLHKIDLFIWPTSTPDVSVSTAGYHGFSVVHWTTNRLAYWAVSDVAVADLQEFASSYRTNLDSSGAKPYP